MPIAALALLAACAGPAPRLAATLTFGPVELAAQGYHQRCLTLDPGARLGYDFSANPPLHFVVEYRQGEAAYQPLRIELAAAEAGWFLPVAGREYCLRWENHSGYPALLRYRLQPGR